MATVTYDAHSSDGSVADDSNTVSWTDCIDKTTGTTSTDVKVLVQYQTSLGTTWSCRRAFIAFDTSGIPNSAHITSANIKTKTSARGADYENLVVVDWSESGTPSLGSDDYNDDGNTKMSGDTTPASVGNWTTFTLNSTGRSNINKTGYSHYCIKNEPRDHDRVEPIENETTNYTTFYDSASSGNEPEINVTYYFTDSSSHNTEFLIYGDKSSAHNSTFTIHDISSHHTEFYIISVNRHNSEFVIYEELTSSHNTRFILIDVIGDWKMNDGTGDTVTDDSDQLQNGIRSDSNITWEISGTQTGEAVGGWRLTTGEYCMRWQDDDTGDAIDIGTNYADLVRYGFSISAWILQTSIPTAYGHGRPIFSTRDWDAVQANNRGISFGDEYGTTDYFDNSVWDSNGDAMGVGKSNFYATYGEKWTHVVMTFDPSAEELKFYINGNLDGTDNVDPITHTEQGAFNARIGGRADSSTTYMFDGYINRVKLYNYALGQTAIDTLYDEGRGLIELISPHNTKFSLHYFDSTSHNTQFRIIGVSRHNTKFILDYQISHNTRFTIIHPETAVESHLGDSSVYKEGTDWDIVHDATSGDGVSTDIRVQIKELTGNYTVQRSFLAFNTEFLENATIIAARLVLKTTSESPSNSPVLIVKEWNSSDTTVDITDFDQIGNQVSYPTLINTSETEYVWYFNSTGIDSINQEGYSYYTLIERDHDDYDSAPPLSTSYETVFYDSESAYEPTLYISYYSNPVSSHNTQFSLFTPTRSTQHTKFIMYIGAESYHRTQFIIAQPDTTTHHTQLTLYDTILTSHNTQFTLWEKSTHHTKFEIKAVYEITTHNTSFNILPDKDQIQTENLEYYKDLQRQYYPKWFKPIEGTVLDIINAAIIEETYRLIDFMQHIIKLLDAENALVAANDGSGLSKNTQLDYLMGLINRERWENENDSDFRDRIQNYVINFLGGGTLAQYRETLTYRYSTIPSSVIRIDEPINPYYDTDNTYFFEKFDNTSPYLERPPDHFGYVHEDTIRVYLDGGDPQTDGVGIWKKYKIVDVQDIAMVQIDVLDTYKSSVNEEEGVITALSDDKCTTPFAGFTDSTDTDASNGIFYVDSGGTEYAITELENIENPYFYHKEDFGDAPPENQETFIDFVTPLTIHHTKYYICDIKSSSHNTQFYIQYINKHNTTFSIIYGDSATHNTQFEIQQTTISHNTKFTIVETYEIYVDSGDGYTYATDSSWSTVYNASTGTFDGSKLQASTSEALSTYTIGRAFLAFDTSVIPDGRNILSATINIRTDTNAPQGSKEFIIQKWDEGGDYTPQGSSFDDGHTNLTSSVTVSGTNEWKNISLNSTGRSWIDKTGYTTFCIKEYTRDANGNDSTPPASSELNQITFYTSASSSYKPYLTIVTY